MSLFLLNKVFSEHHNFPNGEDVSMVDSHLLREIHFRGKQGCKCVELKKEEGSLHTSFYIGVDWLSVNKLAIYVEPKLNKGSHPTDYLKMLFSSLQHPEVVLHTRDLYEIKFEDPYIEIDQQKDIITPLLVVHFLQVVKSIVRKGLKKSYYKVEKNLYGRVKGKILVAENIKHNVFKNRVLNTYCRYEEFGVDNYENRLLKKALVFIQRYLPLFPVQDSGAYVAQVFNYINPAFEEVSPDVSLEEVKHAKVNMFYKEYEEGIRLAKLILKRFGYNINTIDKEQKVKVPPFWIDMAKLFELYVLGKLKDVFGSQVKYHVTKNWNELDYLLNTEQYKMVIDAKYKPVYQTSYYIDDIRQISGYSRLRSIYRELSKEEDEVIDCLVVYPDDNGELNMDLDLKHTPIKEFVGFYKFPVKLPIVHPL